MNDGIFILVFPSSLSPEPIEALAVRRRHGHLVIQVGEIERWSNLNVRPVRRRQITVLLQREAARGHETAYALIVRHNSPLKVLDEQTANR